MRFGTRVGGSWGMPGGAGGLFLQERLRCCVRRNRRSKRCGRLAGGISSLAATSRSRRSRTVRRCCAPAAMAARSVDIAAKTPCRSPPSSSPTYARMKEGFLCPSQTRGRQHMGEPKREATHFPAWIFDTTGVNDKKALENLIEWAKCCGEHEWNRFTRKWRWQHRLVGLLAIITAALSVVSVSSAFSSSENELPIIAAVASVSSAMAGLVTRWGIKAGAIQAESRYADYEYVAREARLILGRIDAPDKDDRPRLEELHQIMREARKTFPGES